ncbi:putative lipopolysaccharide heptosyltransferase III [Thiofilum flexile]|uniref:putative lipopolysaccharide heptosyltransferase III n=1 Tax=Thiofilum flexile TaxID=125627 RepID=UPI00036BC930|nr:putative lipopolysaccharide heptosyltransferase III [Thiofilum flexile]
MKILIMKFRNIGDVLLTSPMAEALATLPAKPEITFLVKKGTEAMLTGHPDIKQVMILPERQKQESQWSFLQRQIAFIQQLRAESFDISINTTEGDRGLIFGWLSGAKRRIGYLKTTDKWWRKQLVTESHTMRAGRRHTVLRNLDLLENIVKPQAINVSIHYTPFDEMRVLDLLKQAGWYQEPYVHIHPVSRWFFKCWRDDYMAQTIDTIQNQLNLRVVLTCAPDQKEREKLNSIISHCKTKSIDLGGQLSLKETAALSSQATFFLGVDSAPMHMAAAVNTPVTALFGPSGTFDWGPWPNGWNQLEVNPYPKRNGTQKVGKHTVIQQEWDCAPCGKAGCENSKRSRCLEELSFNDFLEHVLLQQ